MTCENKNIIYNDMRYNRYMTDDRNQKSGESISKFFIAKKTAIYNYMFMKPKFCFDHRNEYMVNIKKKHRLCPYLYISYSQKTKCPKCKIKKSTKCDECNITASYNFEKLRPLKCLKHRKKGMINVKKNHTLCEKHDISRSKKQEVKYVN